jgi:xanthine dehydrogenase iron-sulfur cluster and FAD-binding subunit A
VAEAALEGASPNPETADRAAEALAGELAPIDDVRSTAEYRRLVAARILHRLIREIGGW